MAVKIVKHGHEPEPQKFAIEFKCPYCHCDFMPTTHLIQSTKTIIPQLLISSCDTLALNVEKPLNKSILQITMRYSVNQHFLSG